MKQQDVENAYGVIWLVRRLFRAMSAAADAYLEHDDLTAADRAVMEFLFPEEKLSVPAIARKYQVSRQHVQVTINRLRQSGLVAAEANPRHRRSQLFRLSDLGREAFAEIRHNEAAVVRKLFSGLDPDDVDATQRLLRSLLKRLESGELL